MRHYNDKRVDEGFKTNIARHRRSNTGLCKAGRKPRKITIKLIENENLENHPTNAGFLSIKKTNYEYKKNNEEIKESSTVQNDTMSTNIILSMKSDEISNLNPFDHIYLTNVMRKYQAKSSLPYPHKVCKAGKKEFIFHDLHTDPTTIYSKISYNNIKVVRRVRIPIEKNLNQFEILVKSGYSINSSVSAFQSLSNLTMKKYNTVIKQKKRNNRLDFSTTRPDKELPADKIITLDNIKFEDEEEAHNYDNFCSKNGERLSSSIHEIPIRNTKRFFNRYFAIQSIIFITETSEQCKRWVYFLNWMIENNK